MSRLALALERFHEWTLRHELELTLRNGLTYRIERLGIHDLYVVAHKGEHLGRWTAVQTVDFLLKEGARTVDI